MQKQRDCKDYQYTIVTSCSVILKKVIIQNLLRHYMAFIWTFLVSHAFCAQDLICC